MKRLETVCKLTNNNTEVQDIVARIRRGLEGSKSAEEIADVTAALTHLSYMTENLKHEADVSPSDLFIIDN